MTVLSRYSRRSVENPSYPLTAQALADMFTRRVSSGVSVNEQTALNIPAVKRAVDLVAGLAAGLPLKLYRDMAGVREGLETPTLLREPYPDVTPFVFWELVFTDLLLWGNHYSYKTRTEGGDQWAIARLLRIPPYEVSVERGEATSRNPSGKRFKVNRSEDSFTPYEVMHIQAQGINGLTGLGRIGVGAEALGVALAAEQTAARLFGDGLQFAGILSSDQNLNDEQARGLGAMFREVLAGGGIGPKIPVLGRGTTFEKISMTADEGQFIQAREFQIREVANLFSVPLGLLSDPAAAMNFGEAQRQTFLDLGVNPWLQRAEQAASMHLVPRGQFFEYTRGAFLRADTQTRFNTYAQAVQFGLMTRNECRRLENLPPVEGGDEMLTPANLGGAANGQAKPGVSAEPGTDPETDPERSRRHGGHANQKVHGGGKGGVELTPEQHEALKPAPRFNKSLRGDTEAKLRATPDGAVLADAINDFQHAEGAKGLRSGITKELNEAGSGGPRAQAVINAVRTAPASDTVLYRGMRVSTSHKQLLEQYKEGATIDMNVSSFSTSAGVAKVFSEGAGRGNTRVIIGVVGQHHSLPIQNLAKNSSVFSEKEFLSGGRFKVIGIDKQAGFGTVISMKQIETL